MQAIILILVVGVIAVLMLDIIGLIASRQFGFHYCMLPSHYRWDISSAQCNTQSQNRRAGSDRVKHAQDSTKVSDET